MFAFTNEHQSAGVSSVKETKNGGDESVDSLVSTPGVFLLEILPRISGMQCRWWRVVGP
jgi:hypothetical protein